MTTTAVAPKISPCQEKTATDLAHALETIEAIAATLPNEAVQRLHEILLVNTASCNEARDLEHDMLMLMSSHGYDGYLLYFSTTRVIVRSEETTPYPTQAYDGTIAITQVPSCQVEATKLGDVWTINLAQQMTWQQVQEHTI